MARRRTGPLRSPVRGPAPVGRLGALTATAPTATRRGRGARTARLAALTGLALVASACRGPLVLVKVSRTESVAPTSVVTVSLNGKKVDELKSLPVFPRSLDRGYQYDHDVGEIKVTLQLTVPPATGVLYSLETDWTGSTIVWTAGSNPNGAGGAGGMPGSAGRTGSAGGAAGRSVSNPGSGGAAGGMAGATATGASGGQGGEPPAGSGGLPGSSGGAGGRPGGSGGLPTGGAGGGAGGRGGGAGSGVGTGGAAGSGGVSGSGGVTGSGGVAGSGGVVGTGGATSSGGTGSPGTGGAATGGIAGSDGRGGSPGMSGNGGGNAGKGGGGAGGAPQPNCVTNSSATCTCTDYCAALAAYCPNTTFFPDGECGKTCASFGWEEGPYSALSTSPLVCRIVQGNYGHCPAASPAGNVPCQISCATFCGVLGRNCPAAPAPYTPGECMNTCQAFDWNASGALSTSSNVTGEGNCRLYWAAFAGWQTGAEQAAACAKAGPMSSVCR